MDNEVLGYKDLAAIPKDKAILDIERPDLMIYEPHFTYSLMEHVELPRSREVRVCQGPLHPPAALAGTSRGNPPRKRVPREHWGCWNKLHLAFCSVPCLPNPSLLLHLRR